MSIASLVRGSPPVDDGGGDMSAMVAVYYTLWLCCVEWSETCPYQADLLFSSVVSLPSLRRLIGILYSKRGSGAGGKGKELSGIWLDIRLESMNSNGTNFMPYN